MRGVIFFVCLCFLLLRGYDCVRTGMLHIPFNNSSLHQSERLQQAKFIHQDQDSQEEHFLCEELEEEDDDNNDAAKKYKLLNRSNLLLAHTPDLIYLHTWSIDRQPFCGRSTYRYIVQRALRI